jgi:hypothetical protein
MIQEPESFLAFFSLFRLCFLVLAGGDMVTLSLWRYGEGSTCLP